MSSIENFSLRETPSRTRYEPLKLDYSNLNQSPRFSGFLFYEDKILASVSDPSGTGEYKIVWWEEKYNPRHVAEAGLSPKDLIDQLLFEELDMMALWYAVEERSTREIAEARERFEKLV